MFYSTYSNHSAIFSSAYPLSVNAKLSSILKGEIGLEFPLKFAQKHMKFYDYKKGRQTLNKSMAHDLSSIISKKTKQSVKK